MFAAKVIRCSLWTRKYCWFQLYIELRPQQTLLVLCRMRHTDLARSGEMTVVFIYIGNIVLVTFGLQQQSLSCEDVIRWRYPQRYWGYYYPKEGLRGYDTDRGFMEEVQVGLRDQDRMQKAVGLQLQMRSESVGDQIGQCI